jgi:hypothetical protein
MTTPRDPVSKLMPNDVDTYAQYAEGIDAARYFDSQAQDLLWAARQRWPLLAALLPDKDGHSGENDPSE